MESSRGNAFENRQRMSDRPSSPAFGVPLMRLGSNLSNISSPSKYNFRAEGSSNRDPVDDAKYEQLVRVCQQLKEKLALLSQKQSLLVQLSTQEQGLRRSFSETKGRLNCEFSEDYIQVSVLFNEGTKRVNKLEAEVKEHRKRYLARVSEEEDTINDLIKKISQLNPQGQNTRRQVSTTQLQESGEVRQLKTKIQDRYAELKQVRSGRESKLKERLREKSERECELRVEEIKLNQKLKSAKEQLEKAIQQSANVSENFQTSRKQIASQLDSKKQREEMSQQKLSNQHLLKVQMGLSELHKLLKSYTEDYLMDIQEIEHLKNALQSQKASAETTTQDYARVHKLQEEIADSEFLLVDLNVEEAKLLSKIYNLQAKVQINTSTNLDHSLILKTWSEEEEKPLPDKIDLKAQLKDLTLRLLLEQHKKKQATQTKVEIQIMERWNREIQANMGATNYDKIEHKKKEIQMYRQQIQVLEAEIIRNDHEQTQVDLRAACANNCHVGQYQRKLDSRVALASLFLCLMIWILW